MAGNTVTVTQTFIGLTADGNVIYNIVASALGDGTSAAIAIPMTKLRKVRGLPGFAISSDDQTSPTYMVSESISGTTVTVTLAANIETDKTVVVTAEAIGI